MLENQGQDSDFLSNSGLGVNENPWVWILGVIPLDLKTYGLKRSVTCFTITQYSIIVRYRIT